MITTESQLCAPSNASVNRYFIICQKTVKPPSEESGEQSGSKGSALVSDRISELRKFSFALLLTALSILLLHLIGHSSTYINLRRFLSRKGKQAPYKEWAVQLNTPKLKLKDNLPNVHCKTKFSEHCFLYHYIRARSLFSPLLHRMVHKHQISKPRDIFLFTLFFCDSNYMHISPSEVVSQLIDGLLTFLRLFL